MTSSCLVSSFAAPSFVIPGTVAANARFLSGKVAEVGLCFFEAQSCLAYGVEDLPATLAALPLSWHVHLPVDLPWEAGGAAAAALALAVLGKVVYLSPRMAVLHPPESGYGSLDQRKDMLRAFMGKWNAHSAVPVLWENIEGCPLVDMVDVIMQENVGVCLDVGHMLGYAQDQLLHTPELLARVALIHWSAPGTRDQHLALTALTAEQRHTARRAMGLVPPGVTHLVEVFHWNGVEASLPVLDSMLEA